MGSLAGGSGTLAICGDDSSGNASAMTYITFRFFNGEGIKIGDAGNGMLSLSQIGAFITSIRDTEPS